ncbi:RNA polymerase sigma factor [Algoriphagus mannitolivorans]|uniref:RNA polymerase sigma factor n=1 Tax=Algoriphagus mannitolivorans TaxID=226504 RepID=UPI00047B1F73|nr:RNA polymerase sigma factor [Algoriphagus mannitolivorans]
MKSFFETHIWPMRGKLFRMVFLWTKDRDLAEDVIQNVFEKTMDREKNLKDHPNLAGWLVKSLKNEVLMHFRKNGRMEALDGLDQIPQSQSNSLEQQESQQIIFRLVEELPEKQKMIFHLREVEEMSYEEIAGFMEISLEQVKVNLHRARKTMRNKLINQGITP